MMQLVLALLLSAIEMAESQGANGGSYFDQIGSVYNYDAYGIKFAANDQYSVLIQNDQSQFVISFAPYGPNASNCTFQYQYPGYEYMYMVAVAKNNSGGQMRFLNIGESFQVSYSISCLLSKLNEQCGREQFSTSK